MDADGERPGEFSPEFIARVAAFLEQVKQFGADVKLLETIFKPDEKDKA